MDNMADLSSTILLDKLIPGYGFLHNVIMQNVGFDATTIIIGVTIALFAVRTLNRIWYAVWDIASVQLMSEINVSSSDEIYSHLLHFFARQSQLKASRRLIADSTVMSDDDNGCSTAVVTELNVDGGGNLRLFNFSNQRASSLLRYTPAFGNFITRHKGTTFWLSRKEMSSNGESNGLRLLNRSQETLKISCLGRSPQPIKDLIQTARNDYFLDRSQSTIIRRPASKSTQGFSTGSSWLTVAQRPSRPLATVALEPGQKIGLLKDINDYLDPASAKWYANRGIPYRRGYLFHGPPGTGKTSLTFALAGLFGLDIHVVSLLDPSLTEDELAMLFTNLAAKSIILLEDIDTAGMSRPFTTAGVGTDNVAGEGSDRTAVTTSKQGPRDLGRGQTLQQGNGISLSGLLNVIDGVSSKEGRVLIMTTNYPDQLDEALIRPGRIDYQIAFGLATTAQIEELFTRMYMQEHMSDVSPSDMENVLDIKYPSSNKPAELQSNEKLVEMATSFARKIPSGSFSPAVIQGYLLKYRGNPASALRDADLWVEKQIENN